MVHLHTYGQTLISNTSTAGKSNRGYIHVTVTDTIGCNISVAEQVDNIWVICADAVTDKWIQ